MTSRARVGACPTLRSRELFRHAHKLRERGDAHLLHDVPAVDLDRGFGRNSTAPAFMALTLIGMSPWPVMKMI
jgi:hypothetical protein